MNSSDIDFSQVEDKAVVGVLMQGILDHIVAYYERENVDLPARRSLNVGATAHDCAQLTVSFIQMYLGPPGDRAEEPQPCHAPRTVVMTIELVRKVALGNTGRGGTTPPDADHVTEHTLDKAQDAWLLMSSILDYKPVANTQVLADISVTPPQGDYQAVVLNLSIEVP